MKAMRTVLIGCLFFGWIWSGWAYLKGHVPFMSWDEGRVSALAEG